MRAVVVGTGEADLAHAAAAAVALRLATAGPVAVVGAPGFPRPPVAPLPTAGALRAGSYLRAAGVRAASRWRLVVCEAASPEEVDEAEDAALEACGVSVTAAASAEPAFAEYDLAVAVLPAGAPPAMLEAARAGWGELADEVVALRLADPGQGRVLPLAGICPPPAWSEELDQLAGRPRSAARDCQE